MKVIQLDVAMNDALRMGVDEGVEHAACDFEGILHRERSAAFRRDLVQTVAGEEFLHDVVPAAFYAYVKHSHDIGM